MAAIVVLVVSLLAFSGASAFPPAKKPTEAAATDKQNTKGAAIDKKEKKIKVATS